MRKMAKKIEAIFEDGVLKPLGKLDMKEHQKVEITILEQPRVFKVSDNPIENILYYIKHPLQSPIEEIVTASDSEID